MHTTNLRKVGGSVMLAIPPAVLDMLNLHAGSMVGFVVDGGRLIIEPSVKPKYTLEELLEGYDGSPSLSDEDRAWVDAPPVGGELL